MAGVHYSNKLEDQAASAALNPHKEGGKPSVLGEDGKLSSASAAMSLKYARAQDLPSFPSSGLKLSSAGAAASLANSNQKSFEHWKPDSIPAANRAAMLAKDYEMDPLWQPELSAAGSRAALLAHKDTVSPELWKSEGTKAGHSAAEQALKSKSPNAITERNLGANDRQKALMAATGAMAGNRPRSDSTPVKNVNGDNWALKAATSSQKGVPNSRPFASGDPGFEAARVQNLSKNNVNRQMYGSAPPVSVEVDEKNRQDTLRASAIAMAKKMYAIQQSHIDEAAGVRRSDSRVAANSSHRRNLSEDSDDEGEEAAPAAMGYGNLEEAARKLAQERLSKMRDEHAEYRQYYGATTAAPRSRLSFRQRRRASTGASKDNDSSDEEQSRRIRSQMSIFTSKVAEVDKKKQQADRNALLEIAHRNVEARMAKMDDQVFQDTGKASPHQKEVWEQQARAKAQQNSDERTQNFGKVHIGGGKYLDQSEVDAIARARLQPTLDEISDTAEKRRARDEEIRLEQERVREEAARNKKRDAEVKAEIKAAQDQEKAEAKKKKAEEKQASKEQAAIEKERLRKEKEQRQVVANEEKEKARLEKERIRLEKEENRKSALAPQRTKEETPVESEPVTYIAPAQSTAVPHYTETLVTDNTVHDLVTVPTEGAPVDAAPELSPVRSTPYEETQPEPLPVTLTTNETVTSPASATSPTKRDSKVKSWFRSFKSSSKPTRDEPTGGELKTVASGDVEKPRDESIRDVAMAGRETDDLYGTGSREEEDVAPAHGVGAEETRTSRSTSISSMSSSEAEIAEARPFSGTEHTAQVGKSGLKAKLLKKVGTSKEGSDLPKDSFVTSKSDEDESYEEAKDQFEDTTTGLPPSLTNAKTASPRASHDHSRFKEEL